MDPILEVRDGWKSFGHVTALRNAHLAVQPGEVLALLGDNGAGKSTLVKVLCGVYELDRGELLVNGERVTDPSPRLLQSRGVATVFQDLAVVETLDIAANMFLGQPIRRFGFLANRRRMIDEAAEALQALKVRLPSVRVPLGELSGGQRQSVAIARAVRLDHPIVIMDEPTAALGVRETAQVGDIIRHLRDSGKAVILVSHDMEFVFEVADRAQVMRLGSVQGIRQISQTDRREIVGLITGALNADASVRQEGANL